MATTRDITYSAGDVTAQGTLALPAGGARVPGVALFADIMGVGEHTRRWAARIADELGYVALAADVYGDGKVPADFAAGMPLIQALLADPLRLAARAQDALDALKAEPRCDGRLAAIGFCFGGSTVLALARAGSLDLMAGASFHGGLSTVRPAVKGNFAARMLVLHGAEDPMVPPADLAAFLAEMAAAGADCQTIAYTGAVHSFTNITADGSFMPGIKYHEPTARRSWNAMAAHFAEVFG